MIAFTRLYERLDSTTSTNLKIEALKDYFQKAPAADAAWALFFLIGRQRKKVITSTFLRRAFREACTLPEWVIAECFSHVGDSSETVSLLLRQKHYLKPPDFASRHQAASRNEALQMSWNEVLHQEPSAPEKPRKSLKKAKRAPNDSLKTDDEKLTDSEGLPRLSTWIEREVLPLESASDELKKEKLWQWWETFPTDVIFIVNKLLAGSFRVGASKRLVTRALAQAIEVEESDLIYRLSGHWDPTPEFFASLSEEGHQEDASRPYPFYLAYPLEDAVATLGENLNEWWAEWKWDGIRAQAIHRKGHSFLWSRGEDLISDSFPDLQPAILSLPEGTVVDAELLAFSNDKPLPFSVLQTRLGRLKPSKKAMEQAPVVLMLYDLLEEGGKDLRALPFSERRSRLEAIVESTPHARLKLSPEVKMTSFEQIEELRKVSREQDSEGLMIKRLSSPYREGRRRGDWWKYKVDPYTVDAVLVYAQAGTGRRSNLFTDYTFAVWQDDELLPVAKAYSGLTDIEIKELDSWIRRHTTDKFGPVRTVKPEQVFELAFENIASSNRHKSGVAVRFPRILRWRKDKPAGEADRIENLKELL